MDAHRQSDSELRACALDAWANHIETGSLVLSADDLREHEPDELLSVGMVTKQLTASDSALIARLRSLAIGERAIETAADSSAPTSFLRSRARSNGA